MIADQEQETAGETTPKAKKPRKEKKQIVDAVIELTNGPGAKVGRGRNATTLAVPKAPAEILTEPRFVPRSPVVARLMQIRADPLAHFMPTTQAKDGAPAMVCAAPPGMDLAPELSKLFMRPVRGPTQHKRRAAAAAEKEGEAAAKKARMGSEGAEGEGPDYDEPDGPRRRTSVAPSVRSDLVPGSVAGLGDLGAGFDESGVGLDSFQLEVPDVPPPDQEELGLGLEMPPPPGSERARSQSVIASDRARSRSRVSTPGVAYEDEGLSFADATCPIAAFDVRHSSQSQTQSQAPSDIPDVREDGKGYSKNTVKALQFIRNELQPGEDEDEDVEKVMSFKQMSEKVQLNPDLAG
jgi:cohesin complex subunit SCC1